MGPIERTHWELDTGLPPESVTDALVDFSPRREVIWKETCDPAVYLVHAGGDTWAEVTEGVAHAWSVRAARPTAPVPRLVGTSGSRLLTGF